MKFDEVAWQGEHEGIEYRIITKAKEATTAYLEVVDEQGDRVTDDDLALLLLEKAKEEWKKQQ